MPTLPILKLRNRILAGVFILALFVILALRLAVPINLTTADVGRHIKNGELILQGHTDLLYRNYYSFTHPDYSFINHHWLFGVLAYQLWQVTGFEGLSVVYIMMLLAALFFFWRAAHSRGHFAITVFFIALSLPMLWDRREIRPEGLSILFMSLYFYLLTKLSLGRIKLQWVYLILIPTQVIWVNVHIFFFMGPLLVGFFLWEGASRGCSVCVRYLRPLLIISIFVNLINPSGLSGAVTPFNIFKGLGYRLAENQNVFFMMEKFYAPIYPYFLITVVILLIGVIIAVIKRGWKVNLAFVVLTIFIIAAGMKAIRLIMPYSFFLVVLGPFFYAQIEGSLTQELQKKIRVVVLCAAIVLTACAFKNINQASAGIGLMPGINASADFYKQAGLSGPIFSNYDIGGYLIYHLAPQEKVFVDNRQEAFPPDFFKDNYIPMQEDNKIWEKLSAEYDFNVIYFYRHDLTPWGQNFLIERIKDPTWAPVFVDGYTLILLKRNVSNQPLIERFELPKSMFVISQK